MGHTARKHALLSASGAKRWLNCTPSAKLEEKYHESTSSSYAAEGTLAHEIADITLRQRAGEVDDKVYAKELAKLKKSELFNPEMLDYVEVYVNLIMEAFTEAKQTTPDAILSVEERVNYSYLVPEGFGTSDAIIIADGTLRISDFKYGKGVMEHAEDNPQLRLYALGALQRFDLEYDIYKVRMEIIQPRLGHYSYSEMLVEELTNWAEKEVKPKAKLAYAGEGVQKAGDWCRWCNVKGMCATLAAENVKLARHAFKDPHLLTDAQIVEVFKQIPMLTDWANAVGEHMLKEAIAGKQWKGYKVVEGGSKRKWIDEAKAIEKLKQADYAETDYLVTKLAGIGAIEKLIGKTNFTKELSECVVKPQGKPTLAPESDKRPIMDKAERAKAAFRENITELPF
jgi:hypothetical protein